MKFTLIELLVVVAIIGILVSILLPSLSLAREKGRMAVCLSNLKQAGISVQLYRTDNDDSFPMRHYNGKNSQGRTWFGKDGETGGRYSDEHSYDQRPLNQYLGATSSSSAEIARCGSDKNSSTYGSYYNKYGSSYRANVKTDGGRVRTLADYSTGEGINKGFNAGSVIAPSETFMLSEYGGISVIYYTGTKYKWHFGRNNRWLYLFVDGSAKPVSLHQAIDDSSGIIQRGDKEAYSGDGWKFYSAEDVKL